MASTLFSDLLTNGIKSGHAPNKNKESRDWFRTKAQEMGKVKDSTVLRSVDKSSLKNPQSFQVGSMYCFAYDAKHKATLPYYDKFPLIFPLGTAKGGIRGINWHYLPYPLRAKLMDALYDTISNDRYDETTKLKINYSILSSASKFSIFKPTVKHYLFKQVRSRLVYIHPTEWDSALFLDIAQFSGASQQKVWADTRRALGK